MSGTELCLRPGSEHDLAEVAAIQAACPEAAQWDVRDYLRYGFLVAVCGGRIAGFAVARRLAADESELLNLAVDPRSRRRGIGRRLMAECTKKYPGTLWLEVRESHSTARKFYERLGFTECGRRADYYAEGRETAIVMNFHS